MAQELSLETATDIALRYYGGFDHYYETDNAYVFDKFGYDGDGGPGAPYVVLKADGAVMAYPTAVMRGLLGDDIAEGEIV